MGACRGFDHFALFLVFVTALFEPAAVSAFVSSMPANAQARVVPFELVAAALGGPTNGATCGLHEGIGAPYDEVASDYHFAAGGGDVLDGANLAQKTFGRMFSKCGAFAGRSVDEVAVKGRGDVTPST